MPKENDPTGRPELSIDELKIRLSIAAGQTARAEKQRNDFETALQICNMRLRQSDLRVAQLEIRVKELEALNERSRENGP